MSGRAVRWRCLTEFCLDAPPQFTNVLAYNMSKAAVNMFTQCVAMGT